MTVPLVSVVMSVYNGERFLTEAIESILDQSFCDFEFIVINDGSTDGSASILESYQKRDSRLRVYCQENRGLIESLNRGCSVAQGRYIARMDADDIAIHDRLLWQVDFMEKHSDVGLLGGGIEYIDANDTVFGTCRHPVGHHAIEVALYQVEGSFCHPATIMRKTHLIASGGYRSAFLDAEDYDLWLRMAECSQLANLDRVVLQYRIHPSQVSQRKLAQQALSLLGAREIALLSETRRRDTLSSDCVITPALLNSLGVSTAEQQRFLAARYRNWVWTLALAGDLSAALSGLTDMFRFSRWEHVEKSFIANLWLIRASLYWRQGRRIRSLLAGGRAVMTWPRVAGRPIKALLKRLGSAAVGRSQPDCSVS